MGIGKRVAGAVISKTDSQDVIPAGPRIQSTQSSSRGLTTGSNLNDILDTAIKSRYDAEDKADDTECEGIDAC